jgi:hypothetical protein
VGVLLVVALVMVVLVPELVETLVTVEAVSVALV